jgi:hypothetical protein
MAKVIKFISVQKISTFVSTFGDRRGVSRILVGKPEGKRPLGKSTRRREDGIKMDLYEVGWRAWTGVIWLAIETGGGFL